MLDSFLTEILFFGNSDFPVQICTMYIVYTIKIHEYNCTIYMNCVFRFWRMETLSYLLSEPQTTNRRFMHRLVFNTGCTRIQDIIEYTVSWNNAESQTSNAWCPGNYDFSGLSLDGFQEKIMWNCLLILKVKKFTMNNSYSLGTTNLEWYNFSTVRKLCVFSWNYFRLDKVKTMWLFPWILAWVQPSLVGTLLNYLLNS